MSRVQGWPPLHRTAVPPGDVRRGDGETVCKAIEHLCVVTKDSFAARAGSPLVLRPWQRKLVGDVYARRADGRLRHRSALIGEPKKNGKSSLGAALAMGVLIPAACAAVYCAGSSESPLWEAFSPHGIANSKTSFPGFENSPGFARRWFFWVACRAFFSCGTSFIGPSVTPSRRW